MSKDGYTKRALKSVTIDYSKGKIYKIINDVNQQIYVGSTTTSLTRRWSGHKTKGRTSQSQFYTAMKDIGQHHFEIMLIELYPCTCKAELLSREYEITNACTEQLYNSQFDGHHSDKTKDKMSGSRFKRGCISKNEKSKQYIFAWKEGKKSCLKGFSYGKKRTLQEACMLAHNHRNIIYPLTFADIQAELPFCSLDNAIIALSDV